MINAPWCRIPRGTRQLITVPPGGQCENLLCAPWAELFQGQWLQRWEGGRETQWNQQDDWCMWHRGSICRKQLVASSNLGSCCATTYCLFHCIVAACNSAVVLLLIASVDPFHPLVTRVLSPPWPAFSGSKHLSFLGFSRKEVGNPK